MLPFVYSQKCWGLLPSPLLRILRKSVEQEYSGATSFAHIVELRTIHLCLLRSNPLPNCSANVAAYTFVFSTPS